jgi:hypothetical protein
MGQLTWLECTAFDADQTTAMGQAFEQACRSLHLPNRSGAEGLALAQKIIALARRGYRDPDRLCALTLEAFADRLRLFRPPLSA